MLVNSQWTNQRRFSACNPESWSVCTGNRPGGCSLLLQLARKLVHARLLRVRVECAGVCMSLGRDACAGSPNRHTSCGGTGPVAAVAAGRAGRGLALLSQSNLTRVTCGWTWARGWRQRRGRRGLQRMALRLPRLVMPQRPRLWTASVRPQGGEAGRVTLSPPQRRASVGVRGGRGSRSLSSRAARRAGGGAAPAAPSPTWWRRSPPCPVSAQGAASKILGCSL